ncbi:DUF4163 domain-containing protein [Tsuneonella sp. HG222]
MPRVMFLAASAALALAGCRQGQEADESTQPTASASAGGASASATASSPGQGKSVKTETDSYTFEYSYPAQAAAIPALAAWLDADAAKARDELEGEALSAKKESETEDFPFHQHSFQETWKVVADLPGWLSLSGDFATYSGGAHGMYGLEGYVWDKARARGFKSEELFESPDYLGSTIGDPLCAALNKERAAKGMEPETGPDAVFPACPSLKEATILVGSSNGKTFDRITVWYGPYVAGSYAEGAYELDFPMTAQMLEAVKPAYRGAFSMKR